MFNRRLLSLITLAVLALAVIGAPPSASAISVNTPAQVTLGCTSFTVLVGGSYTLDRNNTGSGTEQYTIRVVDGAGTVVWSESGLGLVGFTAPLAFAGFTAPYTSTPSYNPITLVYDSPAGNGYESQQLVFGSGTCAGLPTYISAGCDQYVDIPSQAVGGQFVANAPVYFAPQSDTPIDIVIEIGKNYLVAGQDATGQYRKVLISCHGYSPPTPSMAEAPWNGAPLPTTVVQ